MKRRARELEIGQRPTLDADATDEHEGETAARDALREDDDDNGADDRDGETKISSREGDAERPAPTSPAARTDDATVSTDADEPRAGEGSRGRGRPKGTGRSLTGKQYKSLAKDQLTALLADRDDTIRNLSADVESLRKQVTDAAPIAASEEMRELESLASDGWQTASGIAVVMTQDGRWILDRGHLQRLSSATARVIRKYAPRAGQQSPEWGLALAIAGVIAEKLLQAPHPMDAPAADRPALRLETPSAVSQ